MAVVEATGACASVVAKKAAPAKMNKPEYWWKGAREMKCGVSEMVLPATIAPRVSLCTFIVGGMGDMLERLEEQGRRARAEEGRRS